MFLIIRKIYLLLYRTHVKYIVNIRRVFHVNAVKQVAVLADDHGTNYTLRLPKPVLRMLMEDISGKPQITTTQS